MPADPAETDVRISADMAASVRRIAASEGKALGQWIREIVNAEIARREGNCPECGQPRPAAEQRRQEILRQFAMPQPTPRSREGGKANQEAG